MVDQERLLKVKKFITSKENYYWGKLYDQAHRLVKLLEHNAPKIILCNELTLCLRSAQAMDPDAMGKALCNQLASNDWYMSGFCSQPECSNKRMADCSLCSECYDKATKEDEDEQ